MKIICNSYTENGKHCQREAEGNLSFCPVHRWRRWDAYGRMKIIPHEVGPESEGLAAVNLSPKKSKGKKCGFPVEVDGLAAHCQRLTLTDRCWQHGGTEEKAILEGQIGLFDNVEK